MDYDQAVAQGRITLMGAETDEKFLANVMEQAYCIWIFIKSLSSTAASVCRPLIIR